MDRWRGREGRGGGGDGRGRIGRKDRVYGEGQEGIRKYNKEWKNEVRDERLEESRDV